jgi:hypothetical protein
MPARTTGMSNLWSTLDLSFRTRFRAAASGTALRTA